MVGSHLGISLVSQGPGPPASAAVGALTAAGALAAVGVVVTS